MSRVTHFELAYLTLLVGVAITSFGGQERWQATVTLVTVTAALVMALTAPRSRR